MIVRRLIKFFGIFLLLLGVTPLCQAEVGCPSPQDILNISLNQAKEKLKHSFGKSWFENDIGCTNRYLNLMTSNTPKVCQLQKDVYADRFIAFGFEGENKVIGVLYVVGPKTSNSLLSAILGISHMQPTSTIPEPIKHIFANENLSGQYLSEARDRYLAVRRSSLDGGSEIFVFDLVAAENQRQPLEQCAKEGGFWRD